MSIELHHLVLGYAHVVVVNTSISTSRGQNVAVPREGRYTGIVTSHCPHTLAFLYIPHFDFASIISDR